VTKGHDLAAIQALWQAGQRDFGENRVQEAVPKMMAGIVPSRWHMIGHLQENKINKVLPHVHLIHSVDRPALVTALEMRAAKLERRVPVLLEVKTAEEPTKEGVAPESVDELAAAVRASAHLELRGLMTMAALGADERTLRHSFAQLRRLGERLDGVASPILSMGMSDDFEIAIEEGSTMVRVGRALMSS
jgi:pyridoxal phosphate enzyme (YggS family)